MDHQNLSPKSFPAILKPSIKWRTLNLIKQAVSAKRVPRRTLWCGDLTRMSSSGSISFVLFNNTGSRHADFG